MDRRRRTCRPRSSRPSEQIYLNSDEVEGKPEQAQEKIVEGMLGKRFFAAQPGGVLTEQPWIHDTAQTVGQALAEQAARRSSRFKRLSVAGWHVTVHTEER